MAKRTESKHPVSEAAISYTPRIFSIFGTNGTARRLDEFTSTLIAKANQFIADHDTCTCLFKSPCSACQLKQELTRFNIPE